VVYGTPDSGAGEGGGGGGGGSAQWEAWAAGLKPGDMVDCLDKQRRWRVAKIVALLPQPGATGSSGAGATADADEAAAPAAAPPVPAGFSVTFKGWTAKHDEDIPRAGAHRRLAKLGTHTAGKDTRAIRRQGDALDVDLEVIKVTRLSNTALLTVVCMQVLASLELKIDDLIAGEFPAEERVGSINLSLFVAALDVLCLAGHLLQR
jgi:hypothetical protein